jgi:hypothetical protein
MSSGGSWGCRASILGSSRRSRVAQPGTFFVTSRARRWLALSAATHANQPLGGPEDMTEETTAHRS